MIWFSFQRSAVTEQGVTIPEAEIEVRNAGLTSNPDLASDEAGTALTNPFDADLQGFFRFYIGFGRYDILVNGNLLWEDVQIGRPELNDITDLAGVNTAALVDGQQFWLKEWWPGTNTGGGPLEWASSESTANHNGGTIHDPRRGSVLDTETKSFNGYHTPVAGNTGCFVAPNRSEVVVNKFGAASSVPDCTEAVQAALSSGANKVVFLTGSYDISDKLSVTRRDQSIWGQGLKTVIRQNTDNTDVFVYEDGVAAGVRVHEMLITGDGTFTTDGMAFRSEHAGDLHFVGVTVTNLHHGWYIDTRTFVSTSDIWLTRCKTFNTASDGFRFNNCTQLYAIKCDAQSPGDSGFHITDGSAYHLTDCLILSPDNHGVRIGGTNVDWVWLNQVEVDNATNDGYRFINCRGVFITNSWGGSCGAEGWNFLSGNRDFYLTNATSRSNDNHGYAVIGIDGAFFTNCSAFENNADTASDRAGFFVTTGADNIEFNVCDATSPDTSRQAWGFRIAGSADNVKILGGRSELNGTSPVSNVTSGDVIIRNLTGYVTENSGSATSTNADPNVTVSHGLSATPDDVYLTPKSDTQGLRFWISSIGATTFLITLNAAPTSDIEWGWTAKAES